MPHKPPSFESQFVSKMMRPSKPLADPPVNEVIDPAQLPPLEEQPCCLSSEPDNERQNGLGQVLAKHHWQRGRGSAGLTAMLSPGSRDDIADSKEPRTANSLTVKALGMVHITSVRSLSSLLFSPFCPLSPLLTGTTLVLPLEDNKREPANEEILKFSTRMVRREEAHQSADPLPVSASAPSAAQSHSSAPKLSVFAASLNSAAALSFEEQLAALDFALPQPVAEALNILKARGKALTPGQMAALSGQQKRSFEAAQSLQPYAELQLLPPVVQVGPHLIRRAWEQGLGARINALLKEAGQDASWLLTQMGFILGLMIMPRQQGFEMMASREQHCCALAVVRSFAYCREVLEEIYQKRVLLLTALLQIDFYRSSRSLFEQLQHCLEACTQSYDKMLELERLHELRWSFKFKAVHELLQSKPPRTEFGSVLNHAANLEVAEQSGQDEGDRTFGAFSALLTNPLKLDSSLPWALFEHCPLTGISAGLKSAEPLSRRQYTALQLAELFLIPLLWELNRSINRLPPPFNCRPQLMETTRALRRASFMFIEERGSGILLRLTDAGAAQHSSSCCDLLPAVMRCLHLNPPSEVLSLADFKARFNFESLMMLGRKDY